MMHEMTNLDRLDGWLDAVRERYKNISEAAKDLDRALWALEKLSEEARALRLARDEGVSYRESLISLDRKVRFIEDIENHSANTDEFKKGALYAANEIRRGLQRFPEND